MVKRGTEAEAGAACRRCSMQHAANCIKLKVEATADSRRMTVSEDSYKTWLGCCCCAPDIACSSLGEERADLVGYV